MSTPVQFVQYPNVSESAPSANVNIAAVGGNPVTSTVPVSGTVTSTVASVGPTGAAVPADADYVGMNVAGVLTGLTGTTNGLKTDGSGVTQPVSGSGNFTVVQPTGTNLHAVVDSGTVSANQSGIWIVQPGNTANTTPWLVTAGQSGAPWSQNLTQVGGVAITLGQATAAASLPMVLASNQSSIPVTPGPATGRISVSIIRNVYSSTNVTTAAYVQLVASTSASINLLDIFDSSGQTLVIGVGASGSEVPQFNIYPGGNGSIPLAIPSGSRIAIKAISGTASTGELDINAFS